MKKRGLSPVVATILLVAIVIVIALIVFLWLRGITKEAITKFDGTNVEIVCNDVDFDADYESGILYLTNVGNVPIYKFKVRLEGDGSYTTDVVGDTSKDWPDEGLNSQSRYSGSLGNIDGKDKIFLIPVLLGETKEGDKKVYTCEERHAKEILIS